MCNRPITPTAIGKSSSFELSAALIANRGDMRGATVVGTTVTATGAGTASTTHPTIAADILVNRG